MSIDLTLIDLLLRAGQAEAALWALEDHRQFLRAFADDVDAAVRHATAGRVAQPTDDLAGAQPPRPEPTRAMVVRRVAAVAVAILALAWVALAPVWQTPVTQLTVEQERAARDELAAARARLEQLQHVPAEADVVAHARELHDRLLSLPPSALARDDLRAEVDRILRREQDALDERRALPEVRAVLDEIRALRVTLDLVPGVGVPGQPALEPPVPAEDVAPPAQPPPRGRVPGPPPEPSPVATPPEPPAQESSSRPPALPGGGGSAGRPVVEDEPGSVEHPEHPAVP